MAKGILTDKTIEELCILFRQGHYPAFVCDSLRIKESTFFTWLRRGEDKSNSGIDSKDDIYVRLYEEVKKARADSVLTDIGEINRIAQGGQVIKRRTRTFKDGSTEEEQLLSQPHWGARAWKLERTYPEHYAKRDVEDTNLKKALETIRLLSEAMRKPGEEVIDGTPYIVEIGGNDVQRQIEGAGSSEITEAETTG